MADKLKVTLVKSPIGAIPKHRKTVKLLVLQRCINCRTSKQCCYKGAVQQVGHYSKSRRSLIL